jgi:hypothetical protein
VLSDFTNFEKKLQKINRFLKEALKELLKQEIRKIEAKIEDKHEIFLAIVSTLMVLTKSGWLNLDDSWI